MKCQIKHWRSRHKYECCESEIAVDKAKTIHHERTSKLVENSEMVRFLSQLFVFNVKCQRLCLVRSLYIIFLYMQFEFTTHK